MRTINSFFRRAATMAAACAGFAMAPQAGAVMIDSVGDSFAINFFNDDGSLNATAQFTVTNANWSPLLQDQMSLTVGITNNSTAASSRLTSLSILDFDPELSSAQTTGGSSWTATRNTNSGGTSVDLCLWEGQNCNGGGNQGVVGAGGAESFGLNLGFYSLLNNLDFDGFVAKFQTAEGSFHLNGCLAGSRNCNPATSVPEPGTVGLLGLGLLGCAALRRRRQS